MGDEETTTTTETTETTEKSIHTPDQGREEHRTETEKPVTEEKTTTTTTRETPDD